MESLKIEFYCDTCHKNVFMSNISETTDEHNKCELCWESGLIIDHNKVHEYGLHILGYPCKCIICSENFSSRRKLYKHLHSNLDHYVLRGDFDS